MEELLKQLMTGSNGLGAYLSVFGILVACGLGVPLPEDISLILGGFLAHKGAVELPIMMAVGFFGILIGDSLIYTAGRRVGTGVAKSTGFLARVVTPEKRAKVEALFERHGQKVVMIARFLPGVRAVTYFTAGAAKMSYARFIFWDGLAALASAPLFVYLGYLFGDRLELLVEKLKQGQFAVLGGMATLGLAYFLFRRWRTAQDKLKPVAVPAKAPGQPNPSA